MFQANNRSDLNDLAERVRKLEGKSKRWFAANLILRELMIEPHVQEMLKRLSDMLSQQQKDDAVMMSFQMIEQEQINTFVDAFVEHMLNGEDQTPESDAVGGYNQNELDAAAELLRIAEATNEEE